VHRVADAVAGLGVPDAEAAAGAAQEQVVVGVAVVRLQQVVVDVLCRQLGLDSVELHRLELEHHHGARRVLGQRVVDPDRDLFARSHLAIDEVAADQLVRDVLAHVLPVPFHQRCRSGW
jgi:hypothetical protein